MAIKGRITKEELHSSLLNWISTNSGAGSGSFVKALKNSVVISSQTNSVTIGISEYNKDTDTLMVYKNSTYLEENIDYSISTDSMKITNLNGFWNTENSNVTFNFVVFKNTPNVDSLDFYTKSEIENKVQNYRLTENDGQTKYITTNNLDIFALKPGNYACTNNRFINPPIPAPDSSYVEVNVRQDTNTSGSRKIITVYYVYQERIFIAHKHHSYDYAEWKEIEFIKGIKPFYENEKEVLYKKLINIQNENTKSIGFITDTHYIKNTRGHYGMVGLEHIENIIDFCQNGVSDLIVHGGDMINGKGNNNELLTELMDINKVCLNSSIPIYLCRGNHDIGTWKIDSQEDKKYDNNIITHRQWRNFISSKYENKYGFVGDDNNTENAYAYYDFNDIKLRVIMLDVEDHRKEDITDAEGNVTIETMQHCIHQKQMDWIINKALQFDSEGWSVLFISHVSLYSPANDFDSSGVRNGFILHNVIKAFNEHTSYSGSNTSGTHGVTVSCDFSGTDHRVVGMLSGHYHIDRYTKKDNINYIIQSLSAPRDDQNQENRAFGSVNEDCWSVYTIDTSLRKMYISRFGYNKEFEQVIDF